MADLRPILLVEDNPKDIELTLAALEKSRLANDVVVLRDGVEALDYLFRRTNAPPRGGANPTSPDASQGVPPDGDVALPPGATTHPAVVLLDIKLPRVDGLEVLERIKRDAGTRHIPVVMLTSSREEQDLIRSYDLGVNAFVVKPVGYKEFFEAIRELGIFWAVLNEPPPGGNGEPGSLP